MSKRKIVEKGLNKFVSSQLPTVEILRKLGAKVRVVHNRRVSYVENLDGYNLNVAGILPLYHIRNMKLQHALVSTGGNTSIEIDFPNGEIVKGVAECSNKDNFNRTRGIKVAIAHALFADYQIES